MNSYNKFLVIESVCPHCQVLYKNLRTDFLRTKVLSAIVMLIYCYCHCRKKLVKPTKWFYIDVCLCTLTLRYICFKLKMTCLLETDLKNLCV